MFNQAREAHFPLDSGSGKISAFLMRGMIRKQFGKAATLRISDGRRAIVIAGQQLSETEISFLHEFSRRPIAVRVATVVRRTPTDENGNELLVQIQKREGVKTDDGNWSVISELYTDAKIRVRTTVENCNYDTACELFNTATIDSLVEKMKA